MPYLFSHLPYFEREFKLKRFQIEEAYLQRQESAEEDVKKSPDFRLITDVPSIQQFYDENGSIKAFDSRVTTQMRQDQ